MGDQDAQGWITAALLREMKGLVGHAAFEGVWSKFNFKLCIRQGGVEAQTLWLKLAKQILWNVRKERMEEQEEDGTPH